MKENGLDHRERSPHSMIRVSQKARAVAIALWIVGTLAGAAAIQWLLPDGEQYASKQGPQAALQTMQMLFAFVFLSVLPLSVYLFWFGYRAVKWRQIPPPGTWVIRTTKVVEGPKAQRRGQILLALGVLLFAVSLSCAIYFPYRLEQVFHGRPPQPSTETAQPTDSP